MSMISDQVNALRKLAEERVNSRLVYDAMLQAADTIESLSAKLQAANMERPSDCGGWISCKERLPEEYGDYLVAWKPLYMTKDQMIELVGRVVPHFYEIVEYDPDDDKKWIGDIEQAHGQYEIIAWQPLPEPYHEP